MARNLDRSGGKYKKGTVLHTEKPFVFVLKRQLNSERCDYCFSRCELKRCKDCLFAHYCGRECQRKAWFFHEKECQNIRKVSPEVVPDTVRMMARIIIKLQKGGADERGFYSKTKTRVFADLMSHYNDIKNDSNKMEPFVSLMALLRKFLGEDLLPSVAELLAYFGRMICNSFNILDNEMQSIGTGIYLGASVFDHSCSPNAVATFDGTTITIRTIKDLPSIDFSNIYISYIDLLNLPSKRQDELKGNYYFLCQCEKCTNPQELKDMTCIICPNDSCRNGIPGGLLEIAPKCSKCATVVSSEQLEEIKKVIDFTETQLENMKNVAYLDVCRVCLNKQENLLHPSNIYNVKVLDMALASCIDLKNWEEAMVYGLRVKNYLRKYYGEWNPIYGLFLMKLGKIGLLTRYEGSRKLILEAANIFMVTHGNGHPLMKTEMRDLLEDCSA